ncbi:MAG: hypothetical protein HY999_01460 [Nitrospinae bacterium]|nr:hypothetical protein [Nitrospinota bacterium]
MKILHVVKKENDSYAIDIARRQLASGKEVILVLLHDAVLSTIPLDGLKVFACHDDVKARGGSKLNIETIDYQGIVKLIFEADNITSW